MPTYEYRCRDCDVVFEARRPMAESADPIDCPDGHTDTVKLLSVFASTSGAPEQVPAAPCGAACACHPG